MKEWTVQGRNWSKCLQSSLAKRFSRMLHSSLPIGQWDNNQWNIGDSRMRLKNEKNKRSINILESSWDTMTKSAISNASLLIILSMIMNIKENSQPKCNKSQALDLQLRVFVIIYYPRSLSIVHSLMMCTVLSHIILSLKKRETYLRWKVNLNSTWKH